MSPAQKHPRDVLDDPESFLLTHEKLKLDQPTAEVTMDGAISKSGSVPAAFEVSDVSVPLPISAHTPTKDGNSTADTGRLDKETANGITEFVSPSVLGFQGILKKRYTDFLVNEILPSGEVVHLTSTKAPKNKAQNVNAVEETGDLSSKPSTTKDWSQENKPAQIHLAAGSELHASTLTKGTVRETGVLDHFNALPEPSATPSVATNTSQEDPMPVDGDLAAETSTHSSQSSPSLIDKTLPRKLPPHLCVPAPAPSIPLSMQDADTAQSSVMEPEPKKRKKQKVTIRNTGEGWVEIDEEMEKEAKRAKAEADATAGISLDDTTLREEGETKPNIEEDAMALPPVPSTQAQWQAFGGNQSGYQLSRDDRTALVNDFGSDTVDAIVALYNRILDSPSRKPKDYGSVRSSKISREIRSTIHQHIRQIFNSRLETVTENDGNILVTAMPEKPTFFARTPIDNSHTNGRAKGRGKQQRKWEGPKWKEQGGEYLHFSLFKENKDTMEAISYLCRELKMKPPVFQFAGTKDRRAVTVQRVSVFRVLIERMIQVGRRMHSGKIGNFEYRPYPLQLGESAGNEFTITLRDCDFHYPIPVDSEEMANCARRIIGTASKQLKDNGFINYYGLQRFGSFSIGTDVVGTRLLQGDFEGACTALLDFSPDILAAAKDPMFTNEKMSRDDKARAQAIEEFKTTGKAYAASNIMPRRFSAEYNIIRHLSPNKQNRDYQGALQTIPRNLALMYVHAYQSLVWNVVASERWKRHGKKTVEGDLVLIDKHQDTNTSEINAQDVDDDGEAVVQPGEHDRAANPDDMFVRARALDRAEAESGKYTIFDIVLPTPGYDILYPTNEIGKFYEDFMASERGGGLDPHNMRRSWKTISLSGNYRKLLARPLTDLSFDVKVYNDEDEQFVQTDLDRLNQAKDARPAGGTTPSVPIARDAIAAAADNQPADGVLSPDLDAKSEFSDHKQGSFELSGGPYHDYKIAIILKMQLGTSQYATMALRELMKKGGVKTWKPDFSGGR